MNVSRRGFLASATAVSAGAYLAVPSAASAAATSQTYVVTDPPYNAQGDGVTDDSPAINSAISAAAANGGGTVICPAGRYLIKEQIVVPNGVNLQGIGWMATSTQLGTRFLINDDTTLQPLLVTGTGSRISLIAFENVGQTLPPAGTSFTPKPYPYVITVTADTVFLEDLFLLNPTNGIDVENCGRVVMKRIYGQPLTRGIHISGSEDVVHVSDVHFWPFWSVAAAGASSVASYTQSAGIAIESLRNDNPLFSDIFMLGYAIGFHFGTTSGTYAGVTSRFHLENIDIDSTATGVLIDGDGTTGQMSNVAVEAPQSALGGQGLMVSGDNCRVQVTNFRTRFAYTNGVRVTGASCKVSFSSLWVQDWGKAGTAWCAVDCSGSGSKMSIVGGFWHDKGGVDTTTSILSPSTAPFSLAGN